jgi:hypothetical protein
MSVRALWGQVSASFSGQAEAVDVSARGATVTPPIAPREIMPPATWSISSM